MKTLVFIVAILLTGCKSYVEVFKTSSPNSTLKKEGFVFENDTVKVTYSFTGETPAMLVTIFNKLNIPIFVDWKISAFIDNNYNLPYWSDVVRYTGFQKGNTVIGYSNIIKTPPDTKNLIAANPVMQPERIASIAPHSQISKEYYYITFDIIPLGEYFLKTSPFKFRNYLALATDESFTHEFYVDNQFYVSHTEIMEESKFQGKVINNDLRGNAVYEYPYCPAGTFFKEIYDNMPGQLDTLKK